MSDDGKRPGEVELRFDPGAAKGDARLVFIGRLRTPWATRGDCPKNLRAARELSARSTIEIDADFRRGLEGLEAGSHLIVLYWMHKARRDLIVLAPRHASHTSGAFALRAPVRPNPIAFAVVRCLALDAGAGTLTIDAIDAIDGTPVLDIKPWQASTDLPPGD